MLPFYLKILNFTGKFENVQQFLNFVFFLRYTLYKARVGKGSESGKKRCGSGTKGPDPHPWFSEWYQPYLHNFRCGRTSSILMASSSWVVCSKQLVNSQLHGISQASLNCRYVKVFISYYVDRYWYIQSRVDCLVKYTLCVCKVMINADFNTTLCVNCWC